MQAAESLKRNIKSLIVFIMACLVLSGTTAFAVETELEWVKQVAITRQSALALWIDKVYMAVQETNLKYPYLAYGYDWLAMAHLVIAVAFIGPLKDPARNIWVIQFGIIACFMIFPMAFIAGHFRSIPIFWQLIDCSFAVGGLVPLCICYKKIRLLEKLINQNNYGTG